MKRSSKDRSEPEPDYDRTMDLRTLSLQFRASDIDHLTPGVSDMLATGDWRWRRLTQIERDGAIVSIMSRLIGSGFEQAGKVNRWNRGWAENASEYRKTRDVGALRPRYIRVGQPLRIGGDFGKAAAPDFEAQWYEALMRWLFEAWLKPYDAIWEFGCGTGHNLARFAALDPDKRYVGLDWSGPAAALVGQVGRDQGWTMSGRRYDFFAPEPLDGLEGQAALTVGALEQTGDRYQPFIEALVAAKPAIVVHVEPIIEWYYPTDLVDWLAVKYLEQRRYWRGFPGLMSRLEHDGKIEILHKKRTGIGSLYLEGYMIYVWRPM